MEVIKHEEGFTELKAASPIRRKVVHLEELMMTVIEFYDGPMEEPEKPHRHPHEQITYVASGELKLFIEDRSYDLKEGDVFKVASNLNHCIQTLTEKVKLIDGFTPLRKDFL
ncbi:cupin domain-containing protein [Marinilongibacter aquaticus]|uniref:cupin domain-containing protein n=1 Tax=Marinilongibacter aquaticus TaxID=2975157 RepID=UPI0021BD46EB|nr:cupin domain-containing protein [Marinilongibacter aquaticus]UBM59783.1 cupin domain-containing protein [Marinilongibacter aquaticus]